MASRSWATAGLVLGIAVGGFIDGIVAHQLLEWHHMLSGWYPPTTEHNLRINMIDDALFHLGCPLVLLVGIGLLAVAKPVGSQGNLRRLAGWMLAGWGGSTSPKALWTTNSLGAPVRSRSAGLRPRVPRIGRRAGHRRHLAFVVADVDGVVVLRWLCTTVMDRSRMLGRGRTLKAGCAPLGVA